MRKVVWVILWIVGCSGGRHFHARWDPTGAPALVSDERWDAQPEEGVSVEARWDKVQEGWCASVRAVDRALDASISLRADGLLGDDVYKGSSEEGDVFFATIDVDGETYWLWAAGLSPQNEMHVCSY